MDKPNIDRRRLLQAGLCIGCGLVIPGQANAGTIHQLSGGVFINKRRATRADVVQPGDVVSTSHNGRIDFSVEGDAFRLGGFSSIRVGNRDNFLINTLELFTGKLLSVFATGRPRKIVTASLTMGIRGTGVYLDVTPHSAFCCTCYGKTEVVTGGRSLAFDAVHHEGRQFDYEGRQLVNIGPGEMRGHTDDDLRQLESYVGRVPLFDRAGAENG
jgi:hypothetical protein